MRRLSVSLFTLIITGSIFAQDCGISQNLTTQQATQINAVLVPLEEALKDENLYQIDSLSEELTNAFSNQAGIPDATETYFTLDLNTDWIELSSALSLSRALIDKDSLAYVDLWKLAKGMSPPAYQDHSIFLRASAEIAIGLLKIADQETDILRKSSYQAWATRALDSLATMQLPTGAFPFPDLRTYNDPVFTSVIQNFLNSVGADSINVLQNGWIIDDHDTGEFKFDAGVIANAYFEAYIYTGNANYKSIAIAIGDYLQALSFNVNYNYNTFASLGLTRAFQLSDDSIYLHRAIRTIRYAVLPGQLDNGRWVDGHNANSRYHSIIIQNTIPTIQYIPNSHPEKSTLHDMINKAVRNMVTYTETCNSATGFRWLLEAQQLESTVITDDLSDSISDLIGQHINQSAIDGKYLDVYTLGEYMELLPVVLNIDLSNLNTQVIQTYPNPTAGMISIDIGPIDITESTINLFNNLGELVLTTQPKDHQRFHEIDLTNQDNGLYLLTVLINNTSHTQRIVKH